MVMNKMAVPLKKTSGLNSQDKRLILTAQAAGHSGRRHQLIDASDLVGSRKTAARI